MKRMHNLRDVFIVYSSEDRAFVQKEVIKGLKNNGISCLDHEKHFLGGALAVENIQKAILCTRKTVVVLTPNSLQSSWVKYEHLLSLEKSAHTKKVALCYLLCDVKKEEISKFNVLSNTVVVEVDCNKDDWIEKLIKIVTAEQSIESVLPAGNLAVGQVWSHWNGFHKIVLPELKIKIEGSEFYKSNPGHMPVKYFELIPLSCECYDDLTKADNRISIVGSILIQENPRKYTVTVYRILGENKHPYYFVSGYPNVLKVIQRLEKDQQWLKTSQETSHCLTATDRLLQVWRFYYTMNHLLNHPMNRACNNMVRLLVYDDRAVNHSVYDLLLQAVREELLKTSSHHLEKNSVVKRKSVPHPKSRKVCIVASEDSPLELETKNELCELLEREGFDIYDYLKSGQSKIQAFSECISSVQWAIFLFSHDTLKADKFHMYMYNMTLHQNVEKNQLHVIPLLIDVPDDIIPEDFAWVTYIKKEKNYQKRLIETLKCENISLDCSVPAVDVTTGLAWAYVLNYLVINVPVYLQLMDKEFGQCIENPIKIYLLVPASCNTSKKIDPPTDSDKIRFLTQLATKETQVAGALRRYELNLYTVNEAPGKDTPVAVQMVTPIGCLWEMGRQGALSGLKPETLHDQAWKFCKLTTKILEESVKAVEMKLAERVELLYYDDEKCSPADAIIGALTQ
ncbi:hypothetical protein CHS0354_004699 [Potamilus streckersoni]|uniref:TIR domain-containing protein n=1 Tax=Potamilus streckersoni TaxID=2493646 RepID=A0AAE0VZ47_9BIVA|nr:hypothetical protein CHS0354_004699 [Potamilus streckersoni]